MGLGNAHAGTGINRAFESPVCLFGKALGSTDTYVLIVDGIASLDPVTGTPFVVGETVTGVTSTATAVVTAVEDLSATSQRLTIGTLSGSFQNNEAIEGGDIGVGVVDGVEQLALASVKGKGIARIIPLSSATGGGTGRYEIRLNDAWRGLLVAKFNVIDATSADDWEVTIQAQTVATTKLITIYVFKGGAVTSLTGDDTLTFELVLALDKTAPAGF
jgi:hypothetical protein